MLRIILSIFRVVFNKLLARVSLVIIAGWTNEQCTEVFL